MKITAQSIDEYFSKTNEREAALRQLDGIIKKYATHCTPTLFQNMGGGAAIGYGMMQYQSSSMKEPGEWPIIALANQKNYMALYVCATVDGVYIAEKYAKSLGRVSIGKSCIRFKSIDAFNLDVLSKMLRQIDKHFTSNRELFS